MKTYTEPWDGTADGTGDHGRSERRLVRSQLLGGDLFHGFVDAKVQARPQSIPHRVEAKAGIQAAKSVALDDLLDGFNGAKTGLAAEGRVSGGIGGRLGAI